MRTSPYVKGSLLISLLLSQFVEKKYFHGNVGTYKIGEFPQHNTLKVLLLGEMRSLKIHIELEREAFCTTTGGEDLFHLETR